jgi:hypothetical protein
VTHSAKRRKLVGGILFDIFDGHLQQWRQDQPYPDCLILRGLRKYAHGMWALTEQGEC